MITTGLDGGSNTGGWESRISGLLKDHQRTRQHGHGKLALNIEDNKMSLPDFS